MSDFNTWEEIQEWMQVAVDNFYEYDGVYLKIPLLPNVEIRAYIMQDEWNEGIYLKLYSQGTPLIGSMAEEVYDYNLRVPDDALINALKACCADPTAVTVVETRNE